MPIVKCDHCGALIDRPSREINKARHHFCNVGCYAQWQSKNLRGPSALRWRGGLTEFTCATCGAMIKRPRSAMKRARHHFCTAQCRSKWQSQNLRGPTVIVECDHCGAPLTRSPTQIKRLKHHFCNHACMGAYRRGPQHHNFNSEILQCSNCGKSFFRPRSLIHENQTGHFCSRACYDEWHAHETTRARIIVVCDHCGKPLWRTPALIRTRKHHYCNRACFTAWRKEHWKGPSAPQYGNIRTPRIPIACAHCGRILLRSVPLVSRNERHFCDNTCRAAWQSEMLVGPAALRWAGGKVEVTCAFCGEKVLRIRSEVEKRSRRFFCSVTCRSEWQSENVIGPNHPNWLGGPVFWYGPNWHHTQAPLARRRDHFRCKICNASQDDVGRRLDVHHIIAFREFGYIAGENDFYIDANDLSNLITLCPSCHGKADAGKISIARLRSLIA